MSEVRVRMRPHGPLLVTGPISLVDSAGNAFDLGEKDNVALCRCGHSANKPFCDGAHKSCGFQSDERAG